MKALLPIAIALSLVGCNVTPPKIEWFTQVKIDEFTDETSCTVTQGGLYTSSGIIYTINNQVYPAVHFDNYDVFVGVISGGSVRIPVGDVRIRIDNNEPWTLQAANTPKTSLKVDGPTSQEHLNAYLQSLSPEQKAQFDAAYDSAMDATSNMLSPYTFVGGKDAERLINEMKNGKQIRLQRIALGNTTSTVGIHDIDQSFHDALAKCQSLIQ